MKMTIEWHEDCLKNQKKHYAREDKLLRLDIARLNKLENDIQDYVDKINRAKDEGKAIFDSERYGVKRNKAKA